MNLCELIPNIVIYSNDAYTFSNTSVIAVGGEAYNFVKEVTGKIQKNLNQRIHFYVLVFMYKY